MIFYLNEREENMTIMSNDIQEVLLDFITRQYRINKDEIATEESLVDLGVIDSFAFVEIATFLEKHYSISISDSELNADNFGTISSIVLLVGKLIQKNDSA